MLVRVIVITYSMAFGNERMTKVNCWECIVAYISLPSRERGLGRRRVPNNPNKVRKKKENYTDSTYLMADISKVYVNGRKKNRVGRRN